MDAQLLYHVPGAQLSEGPVWDHETELLWWVDIPRGTLNEFDPQTRQHKAYEFGQYIGAAVPRESGGWVLALEKGFAFFNTLTEKLSWIHDPEPEKVGNRFNDGKVDPLGRFWAGTTEITHENPTGSLYCLYPDSGAVAHVLGDIYISNGLAWTKDKRTFYYIDSPTHKLQAYDYAWQTGQLSNGRDAILFEKKLGTPDGMAIDDEDMLWIAFYGGAKVARFNPQTGEQLAQVDVPAERTTSCTFGGANLDTMYITSAAKEGDPHGGAIFVVKPGVSGPTITYFKG